MLDIYRRSYTTEVKDILYQSEIPSLPSYTVYSAVSIIIIIALFAVFFLNYYLLFRRQNEQQNVEGLNQNLIR